LPALPPVTALQDHQAVPLHPSGLPLTAKPLIDAGLLYDDEGTSIRTSKHRMQRIVSTGASSWVLHGACMGGHMAPSCTRTQHCMVFTRASRLRRVLLHAGAAARPHSLRRCCCR
jgi:hypothetical protein